LRIIVEKILGNYLINIYFEIFEEKRIMEIRGKIEEKSEIFLENSRKFEIFFYELL